jgi:hypothetical protein
VGAHQFAGRVVTPGRDEGDRPFQAVQADRDVGRAAAGDGAHLAFAGAPQQVDQRFPDDGHAGGAIHSAS